MPFRELGKHDVLALKFGFQALDPLILGIFPRLGLAPVVEGDMPVIEKLFQPGIKQGRVKIVLIAQSETGLDSPPVQ